MCRGDDVRQRRAAAGEFACIFDFLAHYFFFHFFAHESRLKEITPSQSRDESLILIGILVVA